MIGTRYAGLIVGVAALLVGCTSTPGTSAAPTVSGHLLAGQPMTPCTISGDVPVKASFPAYCGTLQVPEDRSDPSGRQIGLRVAVVPAVAADAKPDPLFALAGGPGEAATSFSPGSQGFTPTSTPPTTSSSSTSAEPALRTS